MLLSPLTFGATVVRVHDPVGAVAVLDDPQRARLYDVVRGADEPVTREQAAREVGISRKLAAFHLDRLVEVGLLEVTFERLGPRQIGRTPKRYRRSGAEVQVSIPERRYDFVGEVLVDAVEGARDGESPPAAAARTAYERGRQVGEAARRERNLGRLGPERGTAVLVDLLAELGFEPAVHGEQVVQRNCPFHHLAQRAPELVCGINLRFVEGVLAGLETPRLRAALDPAEHRCCVVITQVPTNRPGSGSA